MRQFPNPGRALRVKKRPDWTIKRRVDVEERRLTKVTPKTSRKIRKVIWSTKNKWGRRASSFKTEFASLEKSSPSLSAFSFFLLPFFVSLRFPCSCPRPRRWLDIDKRCPRTPASLTKRTLYRMSDPRCFARGKTPAFLREPTVYMCVAH